MNRKQFLQRVLFLPAMVKLFLPSAKARAITGHSHAITDPGHRHNLPHTEGYGACSLCGCQSYLGIHDVCDNCGHAYWYHA